MRRSRGSATLFIGRFVLANEPVIVVSGLPRSGTSLMMQMLAAGGVPILTDGARVANADNPRGYLEYEPVMRTRQDASWVLLAAGKAVKVVHLLLQHLPGGTEYRVLLMRREMQEVLASQREMLSRMGRAGASVSDERMGELFRIQMMQTEQWLREQPNFQSLSMEYSACVADPDGAAAKVNEFLGGRCDETKMAAAVDRKLHRQRLRPEQGG